MKVFSEFDKQTGIFTSQIVCGMCPPETESSAWMPGRFDHVSQRVELQTKQIVSHTPPAVLDTQREKRRALALIADLERRQLRPLRELLIDPNNVEAAHRLATIDEQIATLRESLKVGA